MIKYWRLFISMGILLIGVSFLSFYSSDNVDPIYKELENLGKNYYATGKVLGDGEDYLVGLIDEDLIIYKISGDLREIYRENYSYLKPWKVSVGDVDGNGVDEISIGVYKESPLHKVMAKRPFIYSFIYGELQPKWRGSRLSRPFIDYNFYDLDGDNIDELIAIEILEDGKHLINSYKWKGFGFEGFIETKPYEEIIELDKKEEGLYVNVKEGKTVYWGKIKMGSGQLIIERVK